MLSINTPFFKPRNRTEYLYDHCNPRRSLTGIWLKRTIKTLLLITLGVIPSLFIILTSKPACADNADYYVSMNNISEGSLLLRDENTSQYRQIPLLDTQVNMNISGMLVRSHVKQYFKNTSNDHVEAVYVFPLPETAAVDHMRMQIGERIIEAQIKEKKQARKIYQQAKREGKKTALMEQQRPNMFTNAVANIGPGETVVIEIEYLQILEYDQGNFSLRFPMTITPRYIPGTPLKQNFSSLSSGSTSGWQQNTQQVEDATSISPPITGNANSVSLTIHLAAGFPIKKISSPYHAIQQQQTPDGSLIIQLANGQVPASHDFELSWTPEVNQAPQAALFSEKINNDYYHLLMVLPPGDSTQTQQPLAREVIYVIDTSGSMHGTSMTQAKQSLLMALDRLRLHDRFNIIQFDSTTRQLFQGSRSASFENIMDAKRYVNRLRADGGTEMAPALNLALRQSTDTSHVRQVVFLTDGSVGNETALFDIIHQNLGQSRLFTVGIGSAPNSYFMRKAAQFGRGSFTHIGDVNEIKNKMSQLFEKLENPLLTNIKIDINNKSAAEIWPKRIADLYSGESIVIAIKTDRPLQQVNMQGTRALSPWQASFNLDQTGSETTQQSGIGTFWARRKIAALMDSLHNGANKPEVQKEVTQVALDHHLVSKYTSLVAVDISPSRPTEANLKKQILPNNTPQSRPAQKSYGRLAQTATSAGLQLMIGCTLLLLALISQLLFSRKLKFRILS